MLCTTQFMLINVRDCYKQLLIIDINFLVQGILVKNNFKSRAHVKTQKEQTASLSRLIYKLLKGGSLCKILIREIVRMLIAKVSKIFSNY